MSEIEPKKYTIDSFDRLCNIVNKENAERLAIDLAHWLLTYSNLMDNIRENHPELRDKLNSQIAEGHFVWIDDGKHEMKGFKTEIKQTGETAYYSFSKED